MEAEVATLRWGDYYLREMFSGRAFWPDDDLLTFELGALDGDLELLAAYWKRRELLVAVSDPTLGLNPSLETAEGGAAYYLGAAFNWPLVDGVRVLGEYGLRLRSRVRHALMLRSDYVHEDEGPLRFHLGYQFRWYQAGYGPRDRVEATTSSFNVPENEDLYVTNSFEYFGLSEAFHQWSHTVMSEVHLAFTENWGVFGEAESWTRSAKSAETPPRVLYSADGQRHPGTEHRLFYRTGLRLQPWARLPHRVNLFYTNKQVASGRLVTEEVSERFDRGRYVALELEVFL